MHRNLLNQYIESDSRQAARILLASLESIEATETQEDRTRQAVEEATTLADRLARQHPDNVELHQSMVAVLENMGATQGINVSNESLLSIASKLSGFWRKRKPDSKNLPDEEKVSGRDMDRVIREFLTEMEKTYLNPSWVSKQKFVEGSIPAKDFSGKFQIDGKPVTDPLANIEQHRKSMSNFISSWNGVLKALDSQVQAIDKRVTSEAKRLASSDEEAALNVVRNAIGELNSLPDPLKKFPSFNGTAMGNLIPYVSNEHKMEYVEVKAKMPVTPSDTLPALDKDGILKVAGVIRDAMKNPDYFPSMPWLSWLDFKDGSWFSHWIYDADYSLYEDYYDLFYFQSACQLWSDGIWDLNNKFGVLVGLIKWMDRSIK